MCAFPNRSNAEHSLSPLPRVSTGNAFLTHHLIIRSNHHGSLTNPPALRIHVFFFADNQQSMYVRALASLRDMGAGRSLSPSTDLTIERGFPAKCRERRCTTTARDRRHTCIFGLSEFSGSWTVCTGIDPRLLVRCQQRNVQVRTLTK